ncbi:MAG: hypothetical protein WBO92_03140, partial [Candidatus Moraniibacteriota bacterium]
MDICGHETIRARLRRMADSAVMPQSFLFAGPRQLGKFLVALEFAQKLSGAQGSAEDVTGDVLVIG